jgi:hypothetical protein
MIDFEFNWPYFKPNLMIFTISLQFNFKIITKIEQILMLSIYMHKLLLVQSIYKNKYVTIK